MKFLLAISLILTSFITPIFPLFLVMISAVLLDTSYAIYSTIKLNGKTSFRSHLLFNIVIKLFGYLGTIALLHGIAIAFDATILFGIADLLPKCMCGFWLYIELLSLDETSIKLGNRPFLVIVKEIFAKMKSVKKDISEITGSDKKD